MNSLPIHIRLVRKLSRALPFPDKMRNNLASILFTHFGSRFSDYPAYQNWHAQIVAKQMEHEKLARGHQELYKKYGKAPVCEAPNEHDWYRLALKKQSRKCNAAPVLDVIIPVYESYNDTLRAIFNAVLAPNKVANEVVVIIDGSPNIALVRIIKRLAGMNLFTLLENEENLGFVKTVNRGLKLHPERDCLILNADCMVFGDYADRLLAVAKRYPKTATVTPLTNNGELASYPLQWRDNDWRNEISDRELDALCADVNGAEAVDAPTGVGFCMLMTRASMNDIGYFDEERFGRGYGEENDFCLRASNLGYRNMLAGGVFVRHVGGSSFSDEKLRLIANATRVINDLYPDYNHTIHDWKAKEPAKLMQIALDKARLNISSKPAMLMVLHAWGGGVEKHVCDMARWLEEEGTQVFYLMPVDDDCRSCQLGLFDQGKLQQVFTPNLRFRITETIELLAETLKTLQVRHIHVNHLIGYDDVYYSGIRDLSKLIGVSYDVTLHDYFSICPRTHLIDENMYYCGEPDDTGCNACIAKNGSLVIREEASEPEITAWRQMQYEFLSAARKVFVPNVDVSKRLARYFEGLAFTLRPHAETFHEPVAPVAKFTEGIRRIALIGALPDMKGGGVLKELANDAHARNLPLEFHILGYYGSDDLSVYSYGNVKETGKYQEKELPELLTLSGATIALLPSVCPETFSYALSQVYQLGLYPVVFDIGAAAERIRSCNWGEILPYQTVDSPNIINDRLMTLEVPPQPEALAIYEKQSRYPDLLRDYYELEMGASQK